MTLVHIVLFQFKPNVSKEVIDDVCISLCFLYIPQFLRGNLLFLMSSTSRICPTFPSAPFPIPALPSHAHFPRYSVFLIYHVLLSLPPSSGSIRRNSTPPKHHIKPLPHPPLTSPQICKHMLSLAELCVHPETKKPYILSASGGRDCSPEGHQVVNSPFRLLALYTLYTSPHSLFCFFVFGAGMKYV
jgi:hypothetical protein